MSARALSPEEASGNGDVSGMVFGWASIKPINDFERCQSRRFIRARLWPLGAAVKCRSSWETKYRLVRLIFNSANKNKRKEAAHLAWVAKVRPHKVCGENTRSGEAEKDEPVGKRWVVRLIATAFVNKMLDFKAALTDKICTLTPGSTPGITPLPSQVTLL